MVFKNRFRWYLVIGGVVALCVVAGLYAFPMFWFLRPGTMAVVVCSVGDGDSIFIHTMAGKRILIDSGMDDRAADCIGKYLPPYDRSIDLFLITHQHADHYGGMYTIAKTFQVNAVAMGSVTSAFRMDVAKTFNTAMIIDVTSVVGERYLARMFTDAIVLTGGAGNPAPITSDPNATSVTMLVREGSFGFWFMGDLTEEREWSAVTRAGDMSRLMSVLKVAHHGSKTATGIIFLQAIHPKFALISSGPATPGRPHVVTLNRLRSVGARILTTFNGDICVRTDGKNILTGCPNLLTWQF